MTESMLQSLMKLFAILATINVDVTRVFSRNFVESYLKGQFSSKLVDRSMHIFDQYMEELSDLRTHDSRKRLSSLSVKLLMISTEINKELHLRSKVMILLSIIQFYQYFKAQSSSRDEQTRVVLDAITTISEALMINASEFRNCTSFITERFYKVPDRSKVLVVNSMDNMQFKGVRHLYKAGLQGQFFFLKIAQADLYIFYYDGNEVLELGGKNIFPNHIYVFPKGGSIKGENITPLYFGDVISAFHKDASYPQISLTANQIRFSYKNSENGIHEMNLQCKAGEMVGVMGGSGTGKSTLMSLLNGTNMPDAGKICLNGNNIHEIKKTEKGIIGFVPQDDLLIEELTVFDNLYYNAKLCLGDLEEKEIVKRIGKVLNSLGLFYIKDLKVGSPLNKFISGGQRKRLNIALELIREPSVLFVDEPTSGLSSTDSENVLSLLKEQALSGRIVVTNIHQPSSDMFKLFDKIVIMDKGGYPVYFGNPLDSILYLKSVTQRADASEIQCVTCGTVDTDEILKIIEAKKVNEFGEYIKDRLREPSEWYKLYKEKIEEPLKAVPVTQLPVLNYRIPGKLKQFWIYTKRNFMSKMADSQFVSLSMLIAPALALILGFFTKYLGGNLDGDPQYVFSLNENIPAYLFMCVIVSLFIGLIVSAEEIIRDRKIRARESYLSLSKYAYLNSKIIFLFGLSAIQMFLFVVIGNAILGIKGMNVNYWLILFSTSMFAVMLGLNISAGLKSIISIYINIPFVLVPLILLSGVIVKYDKLHESVSSQKHVPLVGDLMASRWAYEALVVNQFKNNEFEKYFFEIEKQHANTLYYLNFLIPELNNKIEDFSKAKEKGDEQQMRKSAVVLLNVFKEFDGMPELQDKQDVMNPDLVLMKEYLRQWKSYLLKSSSEYARMKEDKIEELSKVTGDMMTLARLKQQHQNEALEELVLNTNELKKIMEYHGMLIRKDTPIFQEPSSKFGRAQFFSSTKQLGSYSIDTIWFNIFILWFMSLILYIALVNDWFRKIVDLMFSVKRR